MYTDILYTLSAPRAGREIHGLSKSTNRLVSTDLLSAAVTLGMVKDTEAFRCRTLAGETYLVYLLPPETHPGFYRQRRHRNRYRRLTTPPNDPPVRLQDILSPGQRRHSEAALRQLRLLVVWLAVLSFLLNAQGTLGLQLWELFISLVKLLIPS